MIKVMLVMSIMVAGGDAPQSMRMPMESIDACVAKVAELMASPPQLSGAHAYSAGCYVIVQGEGI